MQVLRSAQLTSAGFTHGFSTREGGVSPLPEGTLDFALLRDPLRLAENTRRFAEATGFDAAQLYQARQVHGARVLETGGEPRAMHALEADAIVARQQGHAAAVRVADCVPVLLANPSTGHVAAAHAGWRGLVAGVLEASRGALGPGPCLAAIGPCIGACCFEVGTDVAREIAQASEPGVVAPEHAPGKARVNLRQAARAQLRALGVLDHEIEDVGGCTRCDPARYQSGRRDGDPSGRLLGVIVANSPRSHQP
jgi:YfiH family protein